jgi:hypothetical protein
MWTLTSKFYKSGSHPLTTFLFQNSKLLTALPDSSMIHRLTNTSTQQFNDSHFLSCTSTLMRLQKENFDSHSQKRVHPRQLKQFSPSAVHKTRKWFDPSPSPVLPLPNSFRLLLQQELHSTSDAAEKKKHQSAKLPALPLPYRPCPPRKTPSFQSSSSTIVSFVRKLQPFSSTKPPFSIIASPTLAIIRSRHTGSIPIHCSRHANHSVHHPSPKSTKLPIQKYSKSSRHENKQLN